jgi:hypothetical protein
MPRRSLIDHDEGKETGERIENGSENQYRTSTDILWGWGRITADDGDEAEDQSGNMLVRSTVGYRRRSCWRERLFFQVPRFHLHPNSLTPSVFVSPTIHG